MSRIKVTNLRQDSATSDNISLDSSGNVAFQAGSASAPSLHFTGDTNTGIYAPAADSVAVVTAGSARTTVNSGGQLLINSTTSRTNVNTLEPRIQVEGNNNDTSTVAIISNSTADGTAAQVHFCKSSNGTVGSNGAVVINEVLGRIAFDGNDGTNFETGAEILSTMQSTASSGNVSANLRFYTRGDGGSIREAAHINAGGFTKLKGNEDDFISQTGDYHEINSNRENDDTLIVKSHNQSNGANMIGSYCARDANGNYNFVIGLSGHRPGNSADTEFKIRGDGNAYIDGSWNGGGADYAEFFEWSDGNTASEDRRGLSVVLDGDKIREAVAGEDPIGVISGNPSVVGDTDIDRWKGKYLRDDFGTYIQENYEVEKDDGNTVTQQRRQLNPDYNPDVEYVPREQRPEWDCVGLMGKLRIRKGQVTGARWIKMRDISDTVEEWLVR
jgi:hypothetical protein